MDIKDDPILSPLVKKAGVSDEWLDTPHDGLVLDGELVTPRSAATSGCPKCRYDVRELLEEILGEPFNPRFSDLLDG